MDAGDSASSGGCHVLDLGFKVKAFFGFGCRRRTKGVGSWAGVKTRLSAKGADYELSTAHYMP